MASRLDPVALAVMNSRLGAIAEEMGVVLGQTGFSPNIKERRDYSCAVFDARGVLVAQAAHIPIHLGSTPLSVRAAIERLDLGPGDVAALNDPFAGGTHLPDVTVVAPVFLERARRPFAYVANRAHHADIGGMAPGSMALATEMAGATLIIVAQRVSTIRSADQIIVLDGGRIVARGTHTELMAGSECYREIVLSQLTEQEAAA